MQKDIIIIGGGLAGLINAILLARAGLSVLVIERKSYPRHKVCGEYISNEVVPFLKSIDAYPDHYQPADIRRLVLSDCRGTTATMPLDLGGFGISRYALDHFLYEKAKSAGAEFLLDTQVQEIQQTSDQFKVWLPQSACVYAHLVIGAYGKRSRLDKQLSRKFVNQKSPYIGVKYHIKTNMPSDVIALHNFKGGYCGVSHVENEQVNLCYLSTRNNLKAFGNIKAMEENILYQNPQLKGILSEAEYLFEQPEVINEISFASKEPVVDHILMSGDTAGLITPLCGNGMAMAIHSAQILSSLIIQYFGSDQWSRLLLEQSYSQEWKRLFASRLWAGRHIQKLFGSPATSIMGVKLMKTLPWVAQRLMRLTHGKPF